MPLSDWLASLKQGALAELLAARADVCEPEEPGDLGELAERLQREESVERALARLTRPCLQVAEAAAILGEDATEASVTAFLGGPDPAIGDAFATLRQYAVVWPDRSGMLHVVESLGERPRVESRPFSPLPPELPTSLIDPERVELTAAARLGEFVGHAEGMFSECERRPLQVFKSAGVQPKAVQRVMRAARCTEASARLAVACAEHAGLLVNDGAHLRLSPRYDTFALLPPGEQASRLLSAWWELPYAPTLTRSDDGKQLYLLNPKARCDGCVRLRHDLMELLAERVPEGRGVKAPEDLARALAWHRPLACGHPPRTALLGEAVLLGLIAHGARSSFGGLLVAGDPAGLARRASRLLPPFAERATIGADLTATVRGTPSRRLAKELDTIADRMLGPVWQISDESLRRARERGLSAAGIETVLAAVSTAPPGSSLRGRIAKAAADHAPLPRLQEAPATCVFHSADTGLLARTVHHPALQELGMRLLSPNVLIATAPREAVLAALRDAGYPVTEDPAPEPLPPLPADGPATDFTALAGRLRKHAPARPRPARPSRRRSPLERAERVVTREARELTSDEIRLLARAIAEGERVRITYIDSNGVESGRVIRPPYEMMQIGKKKLLKAICETRSAEAGHPEERHFHYSRIQSAEPADSPGPGSF